MLPSCGGPATDLDHLYRTLRPEPLIGKEEFASYYRPQVNEVRGEDTAAGLWLKLRQAYGTLPFRAFLMGHPGVGKSTEITRLLEHVEDQYVGVRLSVSTELNPASFKVFDVLLLMLARLAERADRLSRSLTPSLERLRISPRSYKPTAADQFLNPQLSRIRNCCASMKMSPHFRVAAPIPSSRDYVACGGARQGYPPARRGTFLTRLDISNSQLDFRIGEVYYHVTRPHRALCD